MPSASAPNQGGASSSSAPASRASQRLRRKCHEPLGRGASWISDGRQAGGRLRFAAKIVAELEGKAIIHFLIGFRNRSSVALNWT